MREILRILVVDDDDTDRLSIRRGLRHAGFQIDIVEILDGRTAVEVLKSQHFDVAFLDYRLPDGDGLTVLKEVRAANIKTPIIAFTAFGSEHIAVELMKAGATDYLRKNEVSAETVGQCVRRALRLHQLEKDKAKAIRALANSEKLMRMVMDSIPEQVIVVDKAANIIQLNSACESFIRANTRIGDDKPLAGMNLNDLPKSISRVCKADIQSAIKGLTSVLTRRKKEFEKDIHYRSLDPPQWFSVRVIPLRREQGGAVILHVDITAQKEAEV
jgi:CheY-like chemotaxis protein